MSGLVLKLAPKERVLINGAVIENGDRRTRFSIITPGANILRLREALHPSEANTPVKRVCYIVQLMLCGEADETKAREQVETGVIALLSAFTDAEAIDNLELARASLQEGNYYRCLKALRAVIPIEERYLASAHHEAPEPLVSRAANGV